MGLFKAWKAVKQVAAAGSPDGHTPHGASGMAAGFMTTMARMMGPMMASVSPERGDPLPGTEPGVLDAPTPGALEAGVAALRARDAAFDPQLLTTFAGQVFAAVSAAWGTGDAASVRSVLADSIWDPLAAAALTSSAASAGGLLSRQQGRPALAAVWAGTWYDTARFDVAVTMDLPAEMQQHAPPGSTSWSEAWLFQRSVSPGGAPMTAAESCPSCGAPTAADPAGMCTHCHQPIPVLTSGWLVTYIRSHNPLVEHARNDMVAQVRQQPERLRQMPDELLKLLPPEVVAELAPERAAALRLPPR